MLKPKKSLGQNFLKSKKTAQRIVDLLDPHADDVILEIGPGTGVMTEILIESGAKVYAVDIDQRMINFLAQKYARARNLEAVHSDIMDYDFDQIESKERIKVIGNLPYHMTSPILEKICYFHHKIDFAILTVQKEVAARITAEVGSSDYSALTIFINNYCNAEVMFDLGRKQFHPPPEVTSSVIRLDFFKKPLIDPGRYLLIRDLIKKLFSQRRKKVVNSLMNRLNMSREKAQEILDDASIDKNNRPQNISLEEYVRLADALYKYDVEL
ncbi:MAG TPA: ribosomal RNA small subunit methyltransferase A [candidate division Zixibacteria bacterium]|nr:ribosomal RNA small subunit methyltransferase A [candidate division Zixibacteria bacterium]HEQ99043.1 ribosomal RNA small subunit methyltransferase A [candidate division Zixibacteria bacterium]